MSVWIELRCEHSAEVHAEKVGDSVCLSHRNQGCGEMSSPQPEANYYNLQRDFCNE